MSDLRRFKNPVDPIVPIMGIKDSVGRSWIRAPTGGVFEWQIDDLYHCWFHRKEVPEQDEIVIFEEVEYKVENVYRYGNQKRCPVQMIRIK